MDTNAWLLSVENEAVKWFGRRNRCRPWLCGKR
jgi:hypothetical protein